MSRPLALVTGASGGIGEQLAYAFARGGYDLALVARSADGLARVAAKAGLLGAAVTVLPMDLQGAGAGATLQDATVKAGLTVNVLVNNAGYGLTGAVLEQDVDDQLGMVDLNIRVLTELCRRFGPGMRSRKSGGILNVASTAAFQPGPYMAVYYATKAYVLSYTEALNAELRGSGVHATALCPGPVATGFQARAAFDGTMRLLKAAPLTSAEAVAQAGFDGFRRRRSVVVPGLANAMAARAAPFTPRPLLLRVVEALQRKKLQA